MTCARSCCCCIERLAHACCVVMLFSAALTSFPYQADQQRSAPLFAVARHCDCDHCTWKCRQFAPWLRTERVLHAHSLLLVTLPSVHPCNSALRHGLLGKCIESPKLPIYYRYYTRGYCFACSTTKSSYIRTGFRGDAENSENHTTRPVTS